ncbi:hypothetical protein [Steroidobacter cummioxidans]|uniref:hypothetical protein n=1 Tax=Steroidobacter cummioxidans TaxID=1803913 RepID=UPI0012906FEC|nr:hypothetical protein [Steroidobacter cummioxidans]
MLKLLSGACLLLTGQAFADGPVTAVYKVQELSFQYRLPRQFQACHELQQRVAVILVAVGARDDIKVDVRNCDAYMIGNDDMMDPLPGRTGSDPFDRGDPFDRNDPFNRGDPFNRSSSTFRNPANDRRQTASIRVQLQMPVELTPAVMKEIEKDKSRRELVSRVTRNPAAAMNDPIVFEAQRQEVALSSRTVRLKPEDCDLLEQMRTQVFRKLNVKVTGGTASCGRDSSRIPPQMTVEALLPTGKLLPMPDPEREKHNKSGSGPSEAPAAQPAQPAEPPPQAPAPQ